MKKFGFVTGMLTAGAIGLTAYMLTNKGTSKKANQVLNDMLTETDKMIKNKYNNTKMKHD